jgi:cobalt-zinc-cadmium resistance protein CzcA
LQLAHANNPGLKAATLFVEKEKALLKTNRSLDKTAFSYSLGQINSDMVDYSINISQSFKFPASGARKQVLEAKVAAGESNLELAKSELTRSVRIAFVALINLQKQLELFQQQEDLYKKMLDISTKKLLVGESNILEKTIAKSQYQEVQIARKKIELDLTTHKSNLSILLYTEIQPIFIDEKTMLELPLLDSSEISKNPMLSFYQNTIAIQEKQVTVNKKELFPDFNAGYFNQQIDGTQGFQGIQLGIAIPLFNRYQKAVVNASKIEIEIANQEMENYRLTLYQMLQQQLQNCSKYYLEIEYYKTNGKVLANQLIDFANKAYVKGEIGYIEYIQNIKQAKQIKISYLKSLQKHQSETIEILYLTGK